MTFLQVWELRCYASLGNQHMKKMGKLVLTCARPGGRHTSSSSSVGKGRG